MAEELDQLSVSLYICWSSIAFNFPCFLTIFLIIIPLSADRWLAVDDFDRFFSRDEKSLWISPESYGVYPNTFEWLSLAPLYPSKIHNKNFWNDARILNILNLNCALYFFNFSIKTKREIKIKTYKNFLIDKNQSAAMHHNKDKRNFESLNFANLVYSKWFVLCLIK